MSDWKGRGNDATGDEDRLALKLEQIDQQLVSETPQLDADPAEDAELEGAKRILGLINRVRERDRSDRDPTTDQLGHDDENPTCGPSGRRTNRDLVSLRRIGAYEILEPIARGGMGIVFRAYDPSLNRLVALKMLLAGPFACQMERSRFQVEAEAAASLDHPGIVPVYEVGEYEGQPFFTMGLVDGESLSQRIARQPLLPRTAADATRQIATAVAYAHDQGVIHRDLKPANVLMDRNGCPRITDFGLARRRDSVSDLTGTEQVLGTPSYMAPEQASGGARSAEEAADVYSIGATLYCMLTGRPPLQAATAAETLRLVLDTEPVAPKQLNPAIPKDLNTICLKCLHKEPHRRYASATALEADLSRFIHQEPILARPVGAIERTWKWSRRHPLVAGLSTAVVLTTVALIAGGIWYQSRLSRTLNEVRESRSAAVDSLYQSLTSEAEFLGQMRPIGYGPRVERLIDEASSLDTAANDPYRLRQSLVSSLGFVGAREPVELEKVGAEITAAEVLPDRMHVIAGLRTGQLVLFDLATGRKLAEHDCLSLPVVRVDVDPAGRGPGGQVRVFGQGGGELAVYSWDGAKRLIHVHTTRLESPKSFYGIQTTVDGNRVLGVSPATAEVARTDAWISPATRGLGADVAQSRRRDDEGISFAVASFEHLDRAPRLLPVPASPRFDLNKDLLVVGHSWLDGTEVDDDLQVFDLTTGRLVQSWNASVGALRNVMISDSGRHVACAGDFGVELFHLSADQRIGKYDALGPCSIESMPGDQGDVLVRTERETIWFSHHQNEPIARFPHRDNGSFLRLSSDESYALWIGTDEARVVDLRGQERLRVSAHDRIAKTVSFSPDGRLLLSTGRFYGGNLTRVWDTSTGMLEFEFVGSASTFSPDGRWIACWSDGVKLWDVASGQLAARGKCADTPARIIFSDNGNTLAACGHYPGQSRLWRIAESKSATAREGELVLERVGFDSQAQMPLALSPSGESLAFRRGDSLCVLRLTDQEPFRTAAFPSVPQNGSVAFLDEEHLLVVTEMLHAWDLTTDRVSVSVTPCSPPLALSHDRKLVLCRRQLLRADDLRRVIEFPGWVNSVASVDWSRDGRRIALGLEGGDVAIWDLRAVVAKLDAHDLPRVEFDLRVSPPLEAVGKMIEIGRRSADALHPDQWLYRCKQLTAWVAADARARTSLIRQMRTPCEELLRIDDRPYFSPVDAELRWPEIATTGRALARLFHDNEQYEAQMLLLQAMVSAFESLRPQSPESLRHASVIQHSLGDVLNFFHRDDQLCLQAYDQEQTLLERLIGHPEQPQPRADLASNLFWLDRNRALVHERKGDTEKAIESMDRALSVREAFPTAQVDPATVSKGYDSLIRWLAEAGRENESQEARRRKHGISSKTDE